MGLSAIPNLKNIFSTDAFLLAVLFIVFSSPQTYKMTGRFSEGYIQMFIHGLLLWYVFLWLQSAMPAGGSTKWGLNEAAAAIPVL